MKLMSALVFAGISCLSLANGAMANTENDAEGEVKQYSYGMELDIQRVLEHGAVPDVCGAVPTRMTYENHQGERQTVEYLVMGNGCSNG